MQQQPERVLGSSADSSSYIANQKPQYNFCHQQDHRFDDYIKYLKQVGISVSPKLQCGIFHLKNGLPYPGLYTTQQINAQARHQKTGREEVLVRVPAQMLLTCYQAQNGAPEQLRAVFREESFYHSGPIWQDRILVTYILYIMETDPGLLWSRMASNFSKDTDIISFWDRSQMELFLDRSVAKAAQMERENFENQWSQFQQVQQRQPVLGLPIFTYENYRWIYTHAVSRCFGSFMNSTYFTPFCQFFNHGCVDVSYSCLQAEEYQQKMRRLEATEQTYEEQDDCSQVSSVSCGSGNSIDFIQEDDFSYDEVSSYIIKWNSKVSFNLKQKQVKIIEQLQARVSDFLDTQLSWRGFSLLYIGEMLQRLHLVGNEYKAERKKFNAAKEELEFMIYHIRQFGKTVKNYYKRQGIPAPQPDYSTAPQVQTNSQQQEDASNYLKTARPPEKPYSCLIMSCHSSQHFLPNSEVYFQYGRLSNRTLLHRYGFSLENNRHEHVWIHRRLHKEIGQYPDLFSRIQQKRLPVVFNIKLKNKVLSTELLMLEKMERWKIYGSVAQNNSRDFQKMFGVTDLEQEVQIIARIIVLYEQQLPKYQFNRAGLCQKFDKFARTCSRDGLVDLTSKQLNYHEYFIAVYHNQKIKILKAQIEMLQMVAQIFNKLIQDKVVIQGSTHIMKTVKQIAMFNLQYSRAKLKPIWGYLSTLKLSII